MISEQQQFCILKESIRSALEKNDLKALENLCLESAEAAKSGSKFFLI